MDRQQYEVMDGEHDGDMSNNHEDICRDQGREMDNDERRRRHPTAGSWYVTTPLIWVGCSKIKKPSYARNPSHLFLMTDSEPLMEPPVFTQIMVINPTSVSGSDIYTV